MNLLSSSVIERNADALETLATWLPVLVVALFVLAAVLVAGEALDWLRERKHQESRWPE